MRLLADKHKAGYGNTNAGDTSQMIFADLHRAAQTTAINLNLIISFKVIEALSSEHKSDIKKFSEYAIDTAKLYDNLYTLHSTLAAVPKNLKHVATITAKALFTLLQLPEETLLACNKPIRQFCKSFDRKFPRGPYNLHILNQLILSSDRFLFVVGIRNEKINNF